MCLRRAVAGGPATAWMENRVDGTFTGVGDYPTPATIYSHDGAVYPYYWVFSTGYVHPANSLSITAFDAEDGRIEGTLTLGVGGKTARSALDMTEGVFEVSGALFRGP